MLLFCIGSWRNLLSTLITLEITTKAFPGEILKLPVSQGFTTKALQDLTGGIVQSSSLNSQDRLLTYQVLNSAVPRSTLLIEGR